MCSNLAQIDDAGRRPEMIADKFKSTPRTRPQLAYEVTVEGEFRNIELPSLSNFARDAVSSPRRDRRFLDIQCKAR